MKLYLIIKSNVKTYMFIFTLLVFTSVILSLLSGDSEQNYFPSNYLYIDDSSDIDMSVVKNMSEDYCSTKKFTSDETKPIRTLVPYRLDEQLYYMETRVLPETTKLTQEVNRKKIKDNQLTEPVNLAINYNCDLRENIIYQEQVPGITEMIVGTYPHNSNEILISENYALKLLTLKEMDSYDQLIGQTMTITISEDTDDIFNLQNTEYTISGIYAGDNSLYLYPTEITDEYFKKQEENYNTALFVEFKDENAKQNYIDGLDSDVKYLDSHSVNRIPKEELFKLGLIVITAIYATLVLYLKNKSILKIINYHNYNIMNNIVVYSFTLLIIITFLLINV